MLQAMLPQALHLLLEHHHQVHNLPMAVVAEDNVMRFQLSTIPYSKLGREHLSAGEARLVRQAYPLLHKVARRPPFPVQDLTSLMEILEANQTFSRLLIAILSQSQDIQVRAHSDRFLQVEEVT